MANPVIVPCPADVWTKVATNINHGVINKQINRLYLQAHRTTGSAAPTLLSEGSIMPSQSTPMSFDAGHDVYIWARHDDGSVRVDL